MPPIVKDAWEIELMREAGRIVARGLKLLEEHVRPGVTTAQLDEIFETHVRGSNAVPTFKGYRGFPRSICASINEEVVHGIPSHGRVLKEGDIISIDCGATYKGYVGDAAMTFGVGRITARAKRLIDTTRESLEEAIKVVGPGVGLSKIAATIQSYAESRGYGVVKKFVGHGIGQKMHEEPQVPNYVIKPIESFEFRLKPGICIAIEPMLNEGTDDVLTLDDDWTVVTADRRLSAHFEHTVAVTQTGHEVLTRL